MIGVFDGIGLMITASLFFLFYVPFITVLTLSEGTVFSQYGNKSILIKIIAFIAFVFVTLFLIRLFKFYSIAVFFYYSIVLTCFWLVSKSLKLIQQRKKQRIKADSNH